MKTKKLLALILSTLMIISVLPTNIFAAPSAVVVADTAHEHTHAPAAQENATLFADSTLEVKLLESFGDTWNEAVLSVYKGDELVASLSISDDSTEITVTIEGYDNSYSYSFVWTKGSFDNECDFEIIVDGESIFATESGALSGAQDGDVIFTLEPSCDHSIPEGSLVCSVCFLTCGIDFFHKFDENSVCIFCKTACGTQDVPHNWENKDGVCATCKAECSHSFDVDECSVCGFIKEAYIVAGDDTTYYMTFEEALIEAQKTENSTLYLNKSVYVDSIEITTGKFTLNLGGHTLTTDFCLNVNGTAELIIEGRGTLAATQTSACLNIVGSSKVTIKDGIFNDLVIIQGAESSLTVDGGVFSGDISIYDGEITIIGGANSYAVSVFGGSLAFEEFEGIENVIVYNDTGSVMYASDITLPAGYVFCDMLNFEISEIEIRGYIVSEDKVTNPEFGLYFIAFDDARDSWNDAKIEVYKVNGEAEELVGTIEMTENGIHLEYFELDYDMASAYKFNWVSGSYDDECAFAIFADKELVYRTYDCATEFNNTDRTFLTLEVKCEHEFEDGSNICKNCSLECGKGFAHNFGDDLICDNCGFVCGTEENPHSYEDGYCTICKTECSHNFEDNVCTYCSVKRTFTVKAEGKTHLLEDFNEAVLFAGENDGSILTLYDNVDLGGDGYTIREGNFTLDLNGFTITSSSHTLTLTGETHLTVCDSSQEKTGRIEATASGYNAIILYGYPKLTLDSGTVYSPFRAIDMSDTGWETNATLEINGGKVIVENESGHAVIANGDSVIINGGEIKGLIIHHTGTVDLSGHPNPAGIGIWIQSDEDLSADEYNLPDGYYFVDEYGERADVLEAYSQYTVAGAPVIETSVAQVAEADGTITEHSTIEEAIAKASENDGSTLKLLDNISLSYDVEIWGGKFTIDLNGKTWESSNVVIIINGASEIKICDSSENADGLITTGYESAIRLWDESKLEIESGNFSCSGNYVIDMAFHGNETSSELLISGGKFVCNGVADVAGRKATLTGGEFECAWGYPFNYLYGTLDLSNYKGASEMGFYVAGHIDASDLELILPVGAIIRDFYRGEIVTELTAGDTFIIELPEISYVEIDLGARSADTNIRYAEIDGVVSEIIEDGDKYLVEVGEENLLIEFVEKTADGEVVKTQYFYVDMAAQTSTKLDMDSYMNTYDETSIRVRNPMGIRFKAGIETSAKFEETEFVIDEYGFVVSRKDILGENELTLDTQVKAVGVGYNREENIDIVFGGDDNEHIFTGVVKNIPVEHYKTDLVCKTYTKIYVGGEQFVVYGEPAVGNVYDTAKALLEDSTLDTETKNALYQIVLDYEGTIGLPGDDLYPEG